MTIRIYLVDDHVVLRQSVRVMLEGESDITVVGEAGDAREGLLGIAATRPDVAVVDLKMPGMSGLTAISRIRADSPTTSVVVFTMHDNPTYVHAALEAGAGGYVLKTVTKEEFVRALRAVQSGNTFLQAEVTKPLLRRIARQAKMEKGSLELSRREIEVLEHLADGKTNKQIAHLLSITEETVKAHLKHIYDKLGATDRAHAVAIALRRDLIE